VTEVYFLFRPRPQGVHVHVHVWAGTALQAENRVRSKLGTLIMDPEQWGALRTLLETGMAGVAEASVEIDGETWDASDIDFRYEPAPITIIDRGDEVVTIIRGAEPVFAEEPWHPEEIAGNFPPEEEEEE
jgi:hypothetical protein